MLLLALALSVFQPSDNQVLGGGAFEDLAGRTDVLCPAAKVRTIKPGDLDLAQESFEAQLSPPVRRRLEAANTAKQDCARRNGLACPTTRTLQAMRKVKLMPAFAAFACAHVEPGA